MTSTDWTKATTKTTYWGIDRKDPKEDIFYFEDDSIFYFEDGSVFYFE